MVSNVFLIRFMVGVVVWLSCFLGVVKVLILCCWFGFRCLILLFLILIVFVVFSVLLDSVVNSLFCLLLVMLLRLRILLDFIEKLIFFSDVLNLFVEFIDSVDIFKIIVLLFLVL